MNGRSIDGCIEKAEQLLASGNVMAALFELGAAIEMTERNAPHVAVTSETMRLLRLMTMLHRCKVGAERTLICAAKIGELSRRILQVSQPTR